MRANQRLRRSARGFTLDVLMIVITIIGILIAVATVSYRVSYQAALRSGNENAALKTLQTIDEQELRYYNSHQRRNFGTFDELLKNGMLDARFTGTNPAIVGYVFTLRIIPRSDTQPAGYSISADPVKAEGLSATGRNHYFLDSGSNTIHVNPSQPATATDPPLGQ